MATAENLEKVNVSVIRDLELIVFYNFIEGWEKGGI